MKLQLLLARIEKVLHVVRSIRLLQALLRYGVLAGAEHRQVLSRDLGTVVDIGANRGQFALAVREWAPGARVIAFEPLPGPASIFSKVFCGDQRVALHQAAIGPHTERRAMHVSAKDDSSSLLPISSVQTATYPGTGEIATTEVRVAPLEEFVIADEVRSPAMLKLDVQGFEYEALIGCESMLRQFNSVYCECSFVELYSGQKLAGEMIDWLAHRQFELKGVYNPAYDRCGHAVQADFLFLRKMGQGPGARL